jgi:hypothetical protein
MVLLIGSCPIRPGSFGEPHYPFVPLIQFCEAEFISEIVELARRIVGRGPDSWLGEPSRRVLCHPFSLDCSTIWGSIPYRIGLPLYGAIERAGAGVYPWGIGTERPGWLLDEDR